ncbi:MAG: cytochrome c3 family protein [Coriobacteriia bacterium]
MIRRIIGSFTSASTRPRAIIWSGVVIVGLVVFTATSVIGTSVNWFCTDPCHMVHLDNTKTFEAGSHNRVSCVACHEPVNGGPLIFVIKKIEVAPDLVPTILGTFSLPMNEGSYVAVEMPDDMCVQCHSLSTRTINPSAGIIIDHDVHTEAGVTCPTCHNRVAHPEEDVEYTLPGDEKHENWMQMEACFRCHTLTGTSAFEPAAPGACAACHPSDFDLKPADHDAAGWYALYGESKGHASAAKAETSRVAQAKVDAETLAEVEHAAGPDLPPAATVNYCETCHTSSFCEDCHGGPMPHPADFTTTHGDAGRASPQTCGRCHARSAAEAKAAGFCNACHHPASAPGRVWQTQHDEVVGATGGQPCFECHDPRYCAACHVGGPEAAAESLTAQ